MKVGIMHEHVCTQCEVYHGSLVLVSYRIRSVNFAHHKACQSLNSAAQTTRKVRTRWSGNSKQEFVFVLTVSTGAAKRAAEADNPIRDLGMHILLRSHSWKVRAGTGVTAEDQDAETQLVATSKCPHCDPSHVRIPPMPFWLLAHGEGAYPALLLTHGAAVKPPYPDPTAHHKLYNNKAVLVRVL